MTQQINLYNPAFRRIRDLLSASVVAVAAVLSLAIVVALSGWAQWQDRQRAGEAVVVEAQLKQDQAALVALTQELSVPKRNAQLEADLAAASLVLQGHEDVMRALRNGAAGSPGGYADTLQALARQILPGVWLTNFASAGDSGALTLRGRTLDPAQLPALIKRLAAEKAFKGRQIAEISMQDSSLLSGPKTVALVDAKQVPGLPAATRARFTEFVLTGSKDGDNNSDRAGETMVAGGTKP